MEKEGSKSSCTCVVAIIRMVGHSCNAGAHTIEWMEEGRSAVRLPDAYYAPTIHSLSLSLSLSLSRLSRLSDLRACFSRASSPHAPGLSLLFLDHRAIDVTSRRAVKPCSLSCHRDIRGYASRPRLGHTAEIREDSLDERAEEEIHI